MKNVIAWLRRNCDEVDCYDVNYFNGRYLGHRVRLSSGGIMEIGNLDFDRWANSVAYEFTIDESMSIQKQMCMATNFARKDQRGYMQRSFEVMMGLANTHG
jgi:hypothetical protein